MMPMKHSNKNIVRKQNKFIESIEGIGDILVYQTKSMNRNKTVIESLRKLHDILQSFFDIRTNDPERFDKMALSEKFFKIYEKL